MSQAIRNRIMKIERAIDAAKPTAPGFVLIPRNLAGTREHSEEVRAFESIHKGSPVVIVNVVSGRLDGAMSFPGPLV